MATSVLNQIVETASYHLALLRTVEELEHVPSAHTHQTGYIRELQTELGKVKGRVKELEEKTKKERKEHEILRDSTTRRLAAKLKGKGGVEKFEARKEKEEREYVEALELEMRERENQKMVENMIEEATKVKADLQEKSQRLELTKKEISDLYRQIFDGPTQELPQDDVLEQELASAQRTHNQIQSFLNAHSQSMNLLGQADQMLTMALKEMDDALSYVKWNAYTSGNMTGMMERNALAYAAANASKAEILIRQAQCASGDVQSNGQLRVNDM
ncbi:hypothetical protein BT96DRAFT_825046 [Gymnopus androsaceus JB14]|uniref:Uncharacterized protein n=1 Tax=Gymnopus androsaceus JB14 TaxID=1447944 RepID=A0A6A4HE99_9AGAR|nr:hypothetical protein BT96DRAFT_825046 [Gymnopus androsaceus JB14]